MRDWRHYTSAFPVDHPAISRNMDFLSGSAPVLAQPYLGVLYKHLVVGSPVHLELSSADKP